MEDKSPLDLREDVMYLVQQLHDQKVAEDFIYLVKQLHAQIQISHDPKLLTLMACQALCNWQITDDSVSKEGK